MLLVLRTAAVVEEKALFSAFIFSFAAQLWLFKLQLRTTKVFHS
jgi:hypothetical protein